MMRSLYSGVSGLKTHQTKMDVIGNNISNVNTVAFKNSTNTFSDIMYQTTSGATGPTATTGGRNAKQIGLGVLNGATKISITSSGAAQSTGDGFDIRLSDSNSTSFFIVNNGKENMFTRAGSFYLDGNGNLAMTTTGYMVMGWQVDPNDETQIRQDTVSPLRIMSTENLTSDPEATTEATFSGVIDKDDTNVTSDNGYYRNLTFYDNLGYSYSAKFAYKIQDPDTLTYSVELCAIYDEQNNDVLADYVKGGGKVADLFGAERETQKTYDIADKKKYEYDSTADTLKISGTAYALASNTLVQDPVSGVYGYNFSDGTNTKFVSASELYGIDNSLLGSAKSVSIVDGKLVRTFDTTDSEIKFNEEDGAFEYIGSVGNKAVTFNAAALNDPVTGGPFKMINIDASQMKSLYNGGASTVEVDRGDLGGTIGAGKRLGALIGVSIDGTGLIYGTYDNGNNMLLGQIPVARFPNASGLEAKGNNCYQTTLNSGDFDGIGELVSADGGSMSTGQLEMSNVDLSSEFTEMIVTQRGFQANSRIITTSDTLLEELINLKR